MTIERKTFFVSKFFVEENDNKSKIHWGDTNVSISEDKYEKIANSFVEFAKISWKHNQLLGIKIPGHDIQKQIEISEKHHESKLDKPSGTAVSFAKLANLEESKIEIEEIDFERLHIKYRPKTFNSGLSEYNQVENTFKVEESNFGRIFEYDYKTGGRLWEYKNSLNNEIFWRSSWSRFYQENPLKNTQSI